MPTPDAPGGETPAFPLPEARGGVSPRPRGQPRGRALPSARREPGAVAAFKVCFWSVLWFAGEKACLQTAASELPRRGEEARLCQRRTKPPEFLQTFLGVLGRRKKKYNIYIGAFSLLALPLARLNLNPSLPPPPLLLPPPDNPPLYFRNTQNQVPRSAIVATSERELNALNRWGKIGSAE